MMSLGLCHHVYLSVLRYCWKFLFFNCYSIWDLYLMCGSPTPLVTNLMYGLMWCIAQCYLWPNLVCGHFEPIWCLVHWNVCRMWCLVQCDVWPKLMVGDLFVLKQWCMNPHNPSNFKSGADPGFGEGGTPASKAESCWDSEVELCKRSKPLVARLQGLLKGPVSFWVINAQICILLHSRDPFLSF